MTKAHKGRRSPLLHPSKHPPDSALAEQIRELAGKLQITHIAMELGIGRKKAKRIAADYDINVEMARKADPDQCRSVKDKYRALRKCSDEKWREFMLYGPVRAYTAWQHPECGPAREK